MEDAAEPLSLPEAIERDEAGESEGDQSKLRAVDSSSREREERESIRPSKPQREHKEVESGHGGEQSPSQEPSEKVDRTLALRDLEKYEESKLREARPGPDKTKQDRDARAERGREARTRDKERGRETEERHVGSERGRSSRDRKERGKHEREPIRERNRHERGVGGRGRENERERGRDRDRETLSGRDKDRERNFGRDRGRGDDRERRDRNRVSETELGKRNRGNDKASYRNQGKESQRGFRARRERDGTETPPSKKEGDNKRSKRGRAGQGEGSRQSKDKDDSHVDKVESTIPDADNETAKPSSEVNISRVDSIQGVGSEGEKDIAIPNEASNGQLLVERHLGGSIQGSEAPDVSTISGKAEEVRDGKEQQEGDEQEAKGDDKLVNEKLDASKEGGGSSSKRSGSEKHRRDRRDDERDSRVRKGDRKESSSRDERRSKEDSSGRSLQRSRLSREDSSRRSDRHSPTPKQPQSSSSRSPRRALLADVDSRYRKFGGGRSGLGGYSPRRRRTSPDPQSHSPSRKSKSKSPEKKKVRTWDQVPAGMSPSVAAAMQQYVVAQQAVTQATAAQQAAAKAQQAFAAGQNPFGLAALGLSAGASSSSSLSSSLPSIPVPNSFPVSLPSALSGSLHSFSENIPATLQGLSAALAAPVPGPTSASMLLGGTVNSGLTSVPANVPGLAAPLSSTAFSSISALSAFNPPAGTSSNAGTLSTSIPGLANALVSGLPSISPMLASLLPQMAAATAGNTPVLSQATRPARRLYVGNMPATVSDSELMEFVNASLISVNANHLPGTMPCISCSVNTEKGYAFAEFITPEDAVAALALDGISLHGTTLKIRRPKDYVFPAAGIVTSSTATPASELVPVVDLVSSTVVDSPYKVFIGGISPSLPLEKVKEIITAFGQLRAFRLETDTSVLPARAYAFAEYTALSVTGAACAGLSGLALGGARLSVCRATPEAPLQSKADVAPFYGIPEEAKPLLEPPTRIVELCHMFTAEELHGISDDDFREVEEDIRIECAKLGNVKSLHIVRPEESPKDEEDLASTAQASELASSGENVTTSNSVEQNGTQVIDDTVRAIRTEVQECDEVMKTGEVKDADVTASQGEETTGTATIELVVAQPAEGCSTGVTDGKVQASETLVTDGKVQASETLDIEQKEKVGKIVVNNSSGLIADGRKPRSSSGLQEEKRNDSEVEPWRVGRVYVEYSREDSACKAAHALHGRLFNGRKITCAYLPLRSYQKKFKKGLQPRTVEEKQALALAVQSHLTSHL